MKTVTLAGRTWHFTHAVGRDNINTGFRYPCSMAPSGDGAMWVLSRGMPIWPLDHDFTVTYQPKIGKWSIDDGAQIGDFARNEFVWPTALAVDGGGYLYCCDEYGSFVAVFGPDGPYYELPHYDPAGETLSKWGKKGSEPGQLDRPSGMEFDSDDNLYVVDSGNNRVQKFGKDGRYLGGWAEHGAGESQLDRPWGITLDAQGYVYVADWGNSRVQKFSPGGRHVMSFGASPDDDEPLRHPSDVAVDSDGDVYVADWGNKRVRIFEPDGEVIGSIHGDATEFFGPVKETIEASPVYAKAYSRATDLAQMGRFDRPVSVRVDTQDRLFVVDSRRGRVQIYAKDPAYEAVRLNI